METAFAGTTQECKACEKTVYLVDQLAADNKVYHKACFRCHHCNNTLNCSNYCSFEGVLYCKPHFNQLFKLTGSFDKSFKGAPRTVSRSADQQGAGHVCRYSGPLCRLQEDCLSVLKGKEVGVDGTSYHKGCFRCKHGGCMISLLKYVAHEHRPYCKHHHNQLFKDKGNFSQLDHHEEPNA